MNLNELNKEEISVILEALNQFRDEQQEDGTETEQSIFIGDLINKISKDDNQYKVIVLDKYKNEISNKCIESSGINWHNFSIDSIYYNENCEAFKICSISHEYKIVYLLQQ